MQGYNILIIFNNDKNRLLMCKRKKDPYKGLNNLSGGKIDPDENGLEAAYRELFEETSIPRDAVNLKHLMDFTYYYSDCYVEVYVGRLNRELAVSGDENDLYWSELSHNFFDMSIFAGEGNIGHMLEQVKIHENELLNY